MNETLETLLLRIQELQKLLWVTGFRCECQWKEYRQQWKAGYTDNMDADCSSDHFIWRPAPGIGATMELAIEAAEREYQKWVASGRPGRYD